MILYYFKTLSILIHFSLKSEVNNTNLKHLLNNYYEKYENKKRNAF